MKRGYALATTLVAMIFVMAISGIVLMLTQITTNSANSKINQFNSHIITRQIVCDFNNLSTLNFIENYIAKGFKKTDLNNEIILNNTEVNYYIKIDENNNLKIIEKNTEKSIYN